MKIIIVFIGLLFLSTFLFMGTFAQTTNLPDNFGTTVYQSNHYYYARDSQNNLLVSSGVPDFVIKTALGRGGDIYIEGGTYNLSTSFSGFDLKSNTYLRLAKDAYFVVPSGYGGHVFRFNTNTFNSVIDGGNLNEAAPVQRNWIGVLMQGTSISFNLVENMVITNPFIVIDFSSTSPNYITANTFYNINGNSFVRGIEFDFVGKYVPGPSGFFGNTFRDLQFESGTMTTYGVKGIKHFSEAFYNVIFWDLPRNAISASIDPLADSTIIIGGDMTYPNFEDKGSNTIILDGRHTKFAVNSTQLLAIVKGTNPQVNMPTLPTYQILNMSITPQSTSGIVNGHQGQLVISPGQPTVVNIYGTVNNPKGGSVRLDVTRPDGIVDRNQADVTSSGAFYYPMIFDKNSLTGKYKIDGSYQNSNLGSLVLNVESGLLQNESNANPSINTASPFGFDTIFSTRIKNDARLWSQDKISDDAFISNIQYLVKMGIIVNSDQNQPDLYQSAQIPNWLKNNAGWWADGQISDSDFISVIQYLLNNGIIRMS